MRSFTALTSPLLAVPRFRQTIPRDVSACWILYPHSWQVTVRYCTALPTAKRLTNYSLHTRSKVAPLSCEALWSATGSVRLGDTNRLIHSMRRGARITLVGSMKPWHRVNIRQNHHETTNSRALNDPFAADKAALGGASVPPSAAKRYWAYGLLGVLSIASASIGYYYLTDQHEKQFLLQLKVMNDKVYQEMDNLMVLLFKRPEDLEGVKPKLIALKKALGALGLSDSVQLFYSFTEANTEKDQTDASTPHQSTELTVMLYKGQRKGIINISDDLKVPTELISHFFTAVSEDSSAFKNTKDNSFPQSVTYDTFKAQVIEEASTECPIILQLYEDTCLLCFLMRPFINSLGELLYEYKIPVKIKRLNIEKNDFPEGCPITRATPTFVVYNGSATGDKWKEFRPNELITRFEEQFHLPDALRLKLSRLLEDMHTRFQLIGSLFLWLTELKRLEEKLVLRTTTGLDEPKDAIHPEANNDSKQFDTEVLASIMSQDMQREDNLKLNIEGLKKEIESAENDCMVLGQMMAEALLAEASKSKEINSP